MQDPSPSNADSLKLQLLTVRKKEWWPATADSLPQAVYLTTVKHTALHKSIPYAARQNAMHTYVYLIYSVTLVSRTLPLRNRIGLRYVRL